MTKMDNELTEFLKKTGNEVVLDANVLILILVGCTNKDYIKKVKATKIFSETDYRVLKTILSKFEKLIATPNILTEVSNLAGQKKKYKKELFFKEDLFDTLTKLIDSVYLEEDFIDSNQIANDTAFNRLGLTDVSIIKLLEKRAGVITKDLDLCIELQNRGLQVLNFNHFMEKK